MKVSRKKHLGVLMDPIAAIDYGHDTTLHLLLSAQNRGWKLFYLEQQDLYMTDSEVCAHMRELKVSADPTGWFELGEPKRQSLASLQTLLMRLDPPFDMRYIYTTHILERAQDLHNVKVINNPRSLRDCNEKITATLFPEFCPPTLVSSEREILRDFLRQQQEIILKPLGGMGGQSIFRVHRNDNNFNVIVETMLDRNEPIMAQRFLPEISAGDKRVFIVSGKPIPWMLVRMPAAGENRGNMASGASTEVRELSETELNICHQIAPELRARGIIFAGLDVIGNHLTEVNITSPTGACELERATGFSLGQELMTAIEKLVDD